jgi:hypothetical protein
MFSLRSLGLFVVVGLAWLGMMSCSSDSPTSPSQTAAAVGSGAPAATGGAHTSQPAAAAAQTTPTPYVPPEHGEAECERSGSAPVFKQVVDAAIDGVVAAHPEWFDIYSQAPWILIKKGNMEDYMDAVIDAVNQTAARPAYRSVYNWYDPAQTISVKRTNEFSENYAIVGGPDAVRRAYGATCYPAEF